MGYTDVPGLEHVYLEDSFVLEISATPSRLDLRIEMVLLPDHPRYRPPRPGEANSYVVGQVGFASVVELRWTGQGSKPASDSTGEIDWGALELVDRGGGVWGVVGDWGDIEVWTSELPTVILDDPEHG